MGWVGSKAWICVFSSTDSTKALSCGFKYKPTTSKTFSAKSGSLLILNVFRRWGFRSAAYQICCTCQQVTPACFAISWMLQWVKPRGTLLTVSFRMALTFFVSSFLGRPGREASRNPVSPCSEYRLRHLNTVGLLTSSDSMTSFGDCPEFNSNKIRARYTRFWPSVPIRSRLSSSS